MAMSDTGIEVDLTIGNPGPEGYTCWNASRCKLCSRLKDPRTVLQLFLKRFIILGSTMDLLQWSQEGQRCMLCVYIVLEFIEQLGGADHFVTDATFILRWSFQQQRSVGLSRIAMFEFEMSWGFPQMRVRTIMMNAFSLQNTEAARCTAFGPPNPAVSSPQAFDTARCWIRECDETHAVCSAEEAVRLPSRILEISGDSIECLRIRLHLTQGFMGKYAALSYVWGNPKDQCTTVKENFSDHLSNIPLHKLPPTVRDAVLCTYHLGLRFLWVDALCIVQDDLEDKATEIANMARIYSDAYVTISAAKASNAHEGFLGTRPRLQSIFNTCFSLEVVIPKDVGELLIWVDEHRQNPDYSKLSYREEVDALFEKTRWHTDTDGWSSNHLTIWIAGHLGDQESDDLVTAPKMNSEPISRRGWTLQESWLSRRMLVYGSGQMMWRCRECNKADGGRVPYQTERHFELQNLGDNSGKRAFRAAWQNLLIDFSGRQLGDPSDKLNALQGIIEKLEHQTGDECLAGLWKADLVSGLSWYQDMTNKGAGAIAVSPHRTCPAWSWAKVDGPLAFSIAETVTATALSAVVTKHSITGDVPWATRLEIEGEITIKAPVSRLSALEVLGNFKWLSPDSSAEPFSNHIYLDGGLTNSDFQASMVNGEPIIGCPDGLKFMELSRGKWDGRQNLAAESRGLVLVPVDGKVNTYRRTGFFIVALEEDVDVLASGQNMSMCLSVEEGNVQPTDFGRQWTDYLTEEALVLV